MIIREEKLRVSQSFLNSWIVILGDLRVMFYITFDLERERGREGGVVQRT